MTKKTWTYEPQVDPPMHSSTPVRGTRMDDDDSADEIEEYFNELEIHDEEDMDL